MKKSFILLALLFISALTAKAQDKTYTETTDSLIQFLNKKTMKTNILYDRVMPFANLTEVRDTTDFEYFRQAYSELYRASYNPSFKSNDEVYFELKKDKENLVVVPLGIVDASFDYFNEENIENKEESFIIKSTDNLFLQKQITAIGSLKKWVASTSKIIYSLPSDYIILQNDRKIKRLEVNFDSGQKQTKKYF